MPMARSGHCSARLALLGQHPPHQLFALDTMFEGVPEGGGHPRLIELAGAIDVFAIETVRAQPRMLEQLGEARAEVAQLRTAVAELAAAQAAAVRAEAAAVRAQEEAARVAAARQRLAARIHAALNATYAEALRLSDQRDAASGQRDAARAALRDIAVHAEAITTRSRAWRLARMFKGLRRRIR